MTRKTNLLAVVSLAIGLASAASAFAQGARVFHGEHGASATFTLVGDPSFSTVLVMDFPLNPGNFIREEVDGGLWVHVFSNKATIAVVSRVTGEVLFTGTDTFQISATAVPAPGGGVLFTGEQLTAHVRGELTDAAGNAFQLRLHLIVRANQVKKFTSIIEPQ